MVEAIAFLTSTNNDPKQATAVSVAQDHNHQSLAFRMAINNGNLNEVVKGFREMAAVLEQAARGESRYYRRDGSRLADYMKGMRPSLKNIRLLSFGRA